MSGFNYRKSVIALPRSFGIFGFIKFADLQFQFGRDIDSGCLFDALLESIVHINGFQVRHGVGWPSYPPSNAEASTKVLGCTKLSNSH